MTPQEIEDKVTALSQTYGPVKAICFNVTEEDQVVGFLKAPNYDITLYVSDCMFNKEMSKGGEAIVRGCLIPEESDSRIMDKENYPAIAASFVLQAYRSWTVYGQSSTVKKN